MNGFDRFKEISAAAARSAARMGSKAVKVGGKAAKGASYAHKGYRRFVPRNTRKYINGVIGVGLALCLYFYASGGMEDIYLIEFSQVVKNSSKEQYITTAGDVANSEAARDELLQKYEDALTGDSLLSDDPIPFEGNWDEFSVDLNLAILDVTNQAISALKSPDSKAPNAYWYMAVSNNELPEVKDFDVTWSSAIPSIMLTDNKYYEAQEWDAAEIVREFGTPIKDAGLVTLYTRATDAVAQGPLQIQQPMFTQYMDLGKTWLSADMLTTNQVSGYNFTNDNWSANSDHHKPTTDARIDNGHPVDRWNWYDSVISYQAAHYNYNSYFAGQNYTTWQSYAAYALGANTGLSFISSSDSFSPGSGWVSGGKMKEWARIVGNDDVVTFVKGEVEAYVNNLNDPYPMNLPHDVALTWLSYWTGYSESYTSPKITGKVGGDGKANTANGYALTSPSVMSGVNPSHYNTGWASGSNRHRMVYPIMIMWNYLIIEMLYGSI